MLHAFPSVPANRRAGTTARGFAIHQRHPDGNVLRHCNSVSITPKLRHLRMEVAHAMYEDQPRKMATTAAVERELVPHAISHKNSDYQN